MLRVNTGGNDILLAMTKENLSTWLAKQVETRGWSLRELARRASVSHTAIARAVSGETTPDANTCVGIARALGEQPEHVLRLAGYLPSLPPEATEEKEVISIFRSLPRHRRESALAMLRGLGGRTSPPPVHGSTAQSSLSHLDREISKEFDKLSASRQEEILHLLDRLIAEQEEEEEKQRTSAEL